jgi:hypothetical protein
VVDGTAAADGMAVVEANGRAAAMAGVAAAAAMDIESIAPRPRLANKDIAICGRNYQTIKKTIS